MVPRVTKFSSRMQPGTVVTNSSTNLGPSPRAMTKYGSGGILNEGPGRKLPKGVAVKYQEHLKGEGITPIVNVEENDPILYDKNKFISFYRNKALGAMAPRDRQAYDSALTRSQTDADAYITIGGGIPDFTAYQRLVRDYEKSNITNPTDWSKLSSGVTSYKPEGYRYSKGLPDAESITLPRKAKGGVLRGPSHEGGGINLIDNSGTPIANAEGGERLLSIQDTNLIDSLVQSLNKMPSAITTQKLGKTVQKVVNKQEKNQAKDERLYNIMANS